jgi:vancomycin resistance protein YoaR
VALVGVAAVLGFAFAGSGERLATGIRIADVDVGGLKPDQARIVLERRAARLERLPVTFVADDVRVRLTPEQLGVEVDWAAAVDAARRQTDGFGPVGGLRRLETRVFGVDISPSATVSEPVLRFALDRIARRVGRSPRDAAIVLRGLRPRLVPARTGRALDRQAAEYALVHALTSLLRPGPVALPVRALDPDVRGVDLGVALADVRTALSGPVRLQLGPTRWRLRRWRVAELLVLPHDGKRTITVGGRGASRLFARLRRRFDRAPRDAEFVATADGKVLVRPATAGRKLDEDATAKALLRAATARERRLARVHVRSLAPRLTTSAARALHITRVLSSYSTAYAGTSDRIHNLQRAVSLLDGTIVSPGRVFSLNRAVGRRTLRRGFRPAPVIIDDEYQEEVGGGTSQVATTAFNAAWEAGLKIVERNPHSLYIGRYPLGRDATVNYPDLDLRFFNDTGRPLVVRGFSTSTGITIAIYGSPTGRRVVSKAGPLEATGAVPVETVRDPSLTVGSQVLETQGTPPQSVTVTRTVFGRGGRVLYRETWRTSYRGEASVVRVGTKPKPPPPKPPPPTKPETTKTATTETDTTKTETTPTPPPPPPPRSQP